MIHHPAIAPRPREFVQLAGVWRGQLPDGGAMVEEKVDGVRAWYVDGALTTREGIPICGVGHILHRIGGMEKAYGRPLFLDGEFKTPGGFRATLSHIGKGLRAPEQGTLHLFDCLHADEWRGDECDRPLYARKAMLADLAALAEGLSGEWDWRPGSRGKEPDGPALTVVADQWCSDADEVRAMAQSIWAREGEGVMVKDATAPYRRSRNAAWQKYKQQGWSIRKVA
jgi:ATP-dependent DNA ligase